MKLGDLPYVPPRSTPLYWRDEQSGELWSALLSFLAATIGRGEVTADALETTQDYFRYVINAPCWQHIDIDYHYACKLAELRTSIETATTLELLKTWIDGCLDLGIDPL